MESTLEIVEVLKENNQDFEWYPTTQRMIDIVKNRFDDKNFAIMDIGAGDGRVLIEFGKTRGYDHVLYAIEKSNILIQTWPENIIPLGTDFLEQNLISLPVDYIFCNPPYSEYELWVTTIIESGYAEKAFLIIPRRWANSPLIAEALKKRNATAEVISSDDFYNAERQARAVVDIVEITYPNTHYQSKPEDPFDVWFEQNVTTFDEEKEVDEDAIPSFIRKKHDINNINGLVDAFNEEYSLMQDNYKAIFKLDLAILKELGVHKDAVCKGLKKRIVGLKTKYWTMLFERLDSITSKLCTETKHNFLRKLTSRASIAFTVSNAYAIVIWAVKNANKYFDEQLIKLFKDLTVKECINNYKSNQKTWEKNQWRYMKEDHSHYSLDYRIVLQGYSAIPSADDSYKWEYPNGLHKSCHEKIGDVLAVFNNLGFPSFSLSSLQRDWVGGEWQDFFSYRTKTLMQVKAYKNGNLHYRFMPDAIKALNVQAGKLLGWLKSTEDVVNELGYTVEEADRFFHSSNKITMSNMKLLGFKEI